MTMNRKILSSLYTVPFQLYVVRLFGIRLGIMKLICIEYITHTHACTHHQFYQWIYYYLHLLVSLVLGQSLYLGCIHNSERTNQILALHCPHKMTEMSAEMKYPLKSRIVRWLTGTWLSSLWEIKYSNTQWKWPQFGKKMPTIVL